MVHQLVLPKVIDLPDKVLLQDADDWTNMTGTGFSWSRKDVQIITKPECQRLKIHLTAEKTPVCRIALIWRLSDIKGMRLLGDHWERGYGDFEWRGIVPERVMPWYFLLHDGQRTHGYGVMTEPKAMCFWQVNAHAITLCLDVRCGGMGVLLNGREFLAATVVARTGLDNESPFQAAKAFCKLMSPKPYSIQDRIFGGNNWYYAYGKSSHNEILDDSKFISQLAPAGKVRPFMVIDSCWELPLDTTEKHLWLQGNNHFPDMNLLAGQMKNEGVRPGLWIRPLSVPHNTDEKLLLPSRRFNTQDPPRSLDPSIPEAMDLIRTYFERFVDWGYELIKHDFTTYDLLGRWGFDMYGDLTNAGWQFYDSGKTTAEIITDLYKVIRCAAENCLIVGCNTISHLAAGIFDIQRTGDDTSGRQWERTRKMGINTLAFSLPKHNAFYAIDADCVGITNDVPWAYNKQWMDLLSLSGTPLFVSATPKTGNVQKEAIKHAFAMASCGNNQAEPLDWMDTTCPSRWLLNGHEREFDWYRKDRIEFCV